MSTPLPHVTGPATCQDVIDAPVSRIAQIVGGVLHLQPIWDLVPSFALQDLLSILMAHFDPDPDPGLGVDVRAPGDWVLLRRVEVHLGGDVLVPDIAGWRRARMPKLHWEPSWIDLAPDWACEVTSPATRKLALTGKRDAYAREGVAHLWMVDPFARTLEAFALRDGRYTLAATFTGDDVVRAAPFNAAGFALSDLWRDEWWGRRRAP